MGLGHCRAKKSTTQRKRRKNLRGLLHGEKFIKKTSMTRVKRGIISRKKRAKTLKYTKGYRWDRKAKERAAKEALLHAWTHAFRGRKEKKRNYRRLWQTQINATVRQKVLATANLLTS